MARRGRFAKHDYRIAFLDWLDPPFAAGHRVPDIISWIGCTSVLAQFASWSRSHGRKARLKADFIFMACCGQSVETAKSALDQFADLDIQLGRREAFLAPSPTIMESVGYFGDTTAALSCDYQPVGLR